MPPSKTPEFFVDAPWFREQFARISYSQNAVAAAMGLDRSSWSKRLSGERKITVDEMNRIASLLSVTVDEVARRCGLNVSVSKTVRLARAEVEPPVIGAISAATGEVKFTQAVIYDRVKFLVTGDAYLKEAFLVCDLSAIAVSPSKNHQIALVKCLEGGLFLRKISKTSKKGVFDVFPVMEMGVKKLGISITGIYPVLEIGF